MNKLNFICYNILPLYANHVLDTQKYHYNNAGIHPLHNYPKFDISLIKDSDVIFIKTDRLDEFLTKIFPYIKVKFHLVTGVSDYEISDKYIPYLNNDKIITWSGVNISIQGNTKINKRLIGFQEPDRRRNSSTPGEGGDQELLLEMHKIRNLFNEKIHKILVTHINITHQSRNDVISSLKDMPFIKFADKMDIESYLRSINDYKFVLCPRGNGLDTHRFCEVLLMGSVPIVVKNGIHDLYCKFPCIIVDSFSDVTQEILDSFVFDDEKYEVFKSYLYVDKSLFTI